MKQLSNPQPIGIFPLPAGYLLLPQVAGTDEIRAVLMQGCLPDSFPESLTFYQHALNGNIEAAYQALENDSGPEATYNRFILKSTPEEYEVLQTEFTGELRQLLDVAAYTLGYLASPPEQNEGQHEILALVLMAQATHALEHENVAAAVPLLEAAITAARPVSPIFAAQLIATLAEIKYTHFGPDPLIIQQYQEAIRQLESAGLAETRAELALNLGIVYHDLANGRRGALLEAVKYYQQALAVFTREHHPEPYALAQSNLALAYLSMPLQEAGDQLRMAIAVQSLREALKVYTQKTHPEQWASAQLNLANAYQYLPSTHPEENLAQAVELYEEVLVARKPHVDPVGYARVLANQGNALAHLGVFVHAIPKLQEARIMFESCGEAEAAQAVAALIEQAALQEQAIMNQEQGS